MLNFNKVLIILIITALPVIFGESNCEDGDFVCEDGECIPFTYKCDGSTECEDNSDEGEICKCPANSTGIFICPQVPGETAVQCIFTNQVCNGLSDCPFGEEELNCPDFSSPPCAYKCHNGNCLDDLSSVCDGTDDCKDNSDELHCDIACTLENDLYSCQDNSSCLPLVMVCDGMKNCNDGSDEGSLCLDNLCSTLTCPSNRCIQLPTGPKCHCGKEYILIEDDTDYCEDIDECLTYGICSQVCHNLPGTYKCDCYPGFHLQKDNWTCLADTPNKTWIFYSRSTEIRKFNPETEDDLLVMKAYNATALSANDDYIYWTQERTQLFRLKHGERSVEQALVDIREPITGMAVDWRTGNIYLTTGLHYNIMVCSELGTKCHVLIKSHDVWAKAIALHPSSSRIFWASSAPEPHIGGSFMDGRGESTLAKKGIQWPNSLAVDEQGERLYWTDLHEGKFETMNFDGSDRIMLFRMDSGYGASCLQVLGNRLYWADQLHDTIRSMDKFNADDKGAVVSGGQLHSIYTWTERVSPRDTKNPCANSSCEYLCLLAENDKYTCVQESGDYIYPEDHHSKEDHVKVEVTTTESPSQQLPQERNNNSLLNPCGFFYNCGDGQCIDPLWVCDGERDCVNNSDEFPCQVNPCPIGSFQCKDGMECVSFEMVCDGLEDCSDGSDEVNCKEIHSNVVKCPLDHLSCSTNRSKCIPKSYLCNGFLDCNRGEDELNCPENLIFRLPSSSVAHPKMPETTSCSLQSCPQICTNSTDGLSFTCSCYPQFMLRANQRDCKALGNHKYFLYTSQSQLRKHSFHPDYKEILWKTPFNLNITGIVVDIHRKFAYITSPEMGQIHRIGLEDKKIETVAAGSVNSIGVDWSTGNIYLADHEGSKEVRIRVCNFESRHCSVIVSFDKEAIISDLQIDSINQLMFFTVSRQVTKEKTLLKSRLDGGKAILVKKLNSAYTLDVYRKLIYYQDRDLKALFEIDYSGKIIQEFSLVDSFLKDWVVTSMTMFENKLLITISGIPNYITCKLIPEMLSCELNRLKVPHVGHLLVIQESIQPRVTSACENSNCVGVCVPTEQRVKCLSASGMDVMFGEDYSTEIKEGIDLKEVSRALEIKEIPTAWIGPLIAVAIFVIVVGIAIVLYFGVFKTGYWIGRFSERSILQNDTEQSHSTKEPQNVINRPENAVDIEMVKVIEENTV